MNKRKKPYLLKAQTVSNWESVAVLSLTEIADKVLRENGLGKNRGTSRACDGRDSGWRPHRWSTCGHVRSRGMDRNLGATVHPLPRRSSQGVYLRSLFLLPVKQRIVKRQAFEFKEASSAGTLISICL